MNNLIAFGLASILFMHSQAFSQAADALAKAPITASVPPTKLQAFLAKKGVLVIRDFHKDGKLEKKDDNGITDYWVDVTALAVYEPGKETTKLKGLQCDLTNFGGRGGLDSNLSFLDLDEAESLSKGLVYLIDLAKKWEGQDVGSKEVYFSTKDDFKVGFSKDKDEGGKDESVVFVTSGSYSPTTVRLSSISDLTQFKTMVDEGIDWLKKQ